MSVKIISEYTGLTGILTTFSYSEIGDNIISVKSIIDGVQETKFIMDTENANLVFTVAPIGDLIIIATKYINNLTSTGENTSLNTENFDKNLSSSDDTVRKALETLDDISMTAEEISLIMKDYSETLTNKNITDISNDVHANQVYYKVKSTSGDLTKGQPVSFDSWDDTEEVLKVKPFNGVFSIGIVQEDLANGVVGIMIETGSLSDFDTTGFSPNTPLYPSVSGLTNIRPDSGYQPVGIALNSKLQGSILINMNPPRIGFDFTEYYKDWSDKLIAIQDDSLEPTGYNREDIDNFPIMEFCINAASGVYKRIDREGNYTEHTSQTTFGDGSTNLTDRTWCIRPDTSIGSFVYWNQGIQYTKTTSEIIQAGTGEGKHICTFLNSDIKTALTVHDAIVNETLNSIVYCDGNGNYELFADERHGKTMNGIDHLRVHTTIGTVYGNGMDIEGLIDGQETYTQTTSGEAWDEDLLMTPNTQTTHPFLYRNSEGQWIWTTADNRIAYSSSRDNTTDTYWNRDNGDGTFDLVVSTSSTDYIPYHFLLTNDSKYPIVKIVGQSAYSSRGDARDAIENEIYNLKLGGLPSPELKFLYSVIVRRNTDLENLSDGSTYVDFRQIAGGGSGTTSSNSTYLVDLGDVSITTPNDKQVVTYDSSIDKFIAKDVIQGSAEQTYTPILNYGTDVVYNSQVGYYTVTNDICYAHVNIDVASLSQTDGSWIHISMPIPAKREDCSIGNLSTRSESTTNLLTPTTPITLFNFINHFTLIKEDGSSIRYNDTEVNASGRIILNFQYLV